MGDFERKEMRSLNRWREMTPWDYNPNPIDVSDVVMSPELLLLVESLAENVHDTWARARFNAGWKWGHVRSDEQRTNPCLVPYAELPEEEKEYDRNTAMSTIKVIKKLGFEITRKG